jgi:phage-related protein
MQTLPLPCKLLVDKQPSLSFTSAASEVTNVDEQVIKLGINSVKRNYKLTWEGLQTKAEKNTVETFLSIVGTWNSFLISETSSAEEQVKVVCSKTYEVSNDGRFFKISVEAQEVFR